MFPKPTNYSFFVIITLLVSYVVLIFPILVGPGRSTEDRKISSPSSSITLYVRETQAQTHMSSSLYGGSLGLLLSSKKQAEISYSSNAEDQSNTIDFHSLTHF